MFGEALKILRRQRTEIDIRRAAGQEPTPAEILSFIDRVEELAMQMGEELPNRRASLIHKFKMRSELNGILDDLRHQRRSYLVRMRHGC